jgi:hypothetical protein
MCAETIWPALTSMTPDTLMIPNLYFLVWGQKP